MNIDNKNSIVIYEAKDGGVELKVDIEKDTIWATQEQIAKLFEIDRTVITKHIKNIILDKELIEKSVCAKFAHTAEDGKKYMVNFYNLDVILSVGYRVNSKKAIQFRIWATSVLREYLKNGYALNEYKLNKSSELLEGLEETLKFMKSNKGKVKGRLTLKISKDLERGE